MKVVNVKESDVYVARISPDDRRSEVYGYYDSYFKAEESVAGKSFYGSNGTVDHQPQKAITLTFEDGSKLSFLRTSAFEIRTETEAERVARLEKVKQNALSKLNPEEKRALGLI
ncbi:hypothetical protein CC31p091 [Enterobacter phage CC31]|uniref:Uncharacterized protein n=1 Tax=Enterobacter phage CC31 TaxID=709484 RepID=E5DIA2_9CAUD|nr:hypothetical protein CC31p091 [Enterobacter phage CC31]ADB81587.1 conserved hypothetical protein [Enterobacter phage CC31]